MNYYTLLIAFGVCVALIPNLGFPGEWKTVMLSALGVLIALCAYMAQRLLPAEKETEDDASDIRVLPEPSEAENR